MSNKAFRAHIKADKAKGKKRGVASNPMCGIPSTNDHTERDKVIDRLKRKGTA